jgi:hypothetical protein
MYPRHTLTLFGFAVLVSSCSTLPSETDELCRRIADFANASPAGELHTVRLTTDWGGEFNYRRALGCIGVRSAGTKPARRTE